MRTLKDLSVFSKTWYLFKSRFSLLKTKFWINRIKNQTDMQYQKARLSIPLFRFYDPTALIQWVVRSDTQFGGDSEGQIGITPNITLKLVGRIKTQDKNRMIDLPSLGIRPRNQNDGVKVHNFNMINIKVKTNGDLYRVILKGNVPWMGDYYGQALIVSSSKQWQQYQIPINSFQPSNNPMFAKTFQQITQLNDLKITGFQFYTQSEVDKDIQFQISEINLVYQNGAKQFAKRFQKKYFIKPMGDYVNGKVVNDGRDIYTMKFKSE